jgi:hypothetical protein
VHRLWLFELQQQLLGLLRLPLHRRQLERWHCSERQQLRLQQLGFASAVEA